MVWTDIFIRRPVLSVVVSMLILLIGLRAAMVLPIRQYPKLSNTVVNISTVYPGASADLIQGFITTPIEQAVAEACAKAMWLDDHAGARQGRSH